MVSFPCVLDCIYFCFGGRELTPSQWFFPISNIMQSSGGLQITSWYLGPSFYPGTGSLHAWFWLLPPGAHACWVLGVAVCYLCETNGVTCFMQVQEVKEQVQEDVFILGHSSVFHLFHFGICLWRFLAQFFCSSPAFWVVLLRSSHIQALSHGSPTWWQATSHQLSCQIFIILDALKITAVISCFSNI